MCQQENENRQTWRFLRMTTTANKPEPSIQTAAGTGTGRLMSKV